MINQPKSYISHRVLLGVVVLLLILSFVPASGGPLIEVVIHKAGIGAVNNSASEYLEKQREQALEGFLVLSALKVGLAVLRSSEVGLILNVKIGDLAIAVYDYVNFAWKILLAAVAYYYLAQFLLDLAGTVDIWFIWTALVCSGMYLAITSVRKKPVKPAAFLSRTGIVAAVFALILYLGLPLAFVGAGWVSVHITGGTIRDANRLYLDIEDEMPGFMDGGGQVNSDRSEIRTPSVTVPVPYDGADPSQAVVEDSGEGGGQHRLTLGLWPREKLMELRDYLEARSRSLASAVLRQTAAYLFNIVVFPLLTILALYWSGRHILTLGIPVLQPAGESTAGSDIRRLSEAVTRLERTVREIKSGSKHPERPG